MSLLVEAAGLMKTHGRGRASVDALRGVDVTIGRGEWVAVIGPSGSGKSTLMHILGCLDRPTSGSYLFDGRDVGRMSGDQLASMRSREIGFVFQTFNLLPRLSAVANVAMPLAYAGVTPANAIGRARELLERVGLSDRTHHVPTQMSGGEQQRVAIARALVNDPQMILADEPTGNLDTRTGRDILDLFRTLNESGTTLVVVTHDPEVAAMAPRVIEMRDGLVLRDERDWDR